MAKLENLQQYEWALARVEELLKVTEDRPDDPHMIELTILSNLVAEYSEEHFAIGSPTIAEVLELKMYELGINQKELAAMLNVSPSRICEYISGKCEPTLKVAREMCHKLGIAPAVLLA